MIQEKLMTESSFSLNEDYKELDNNVWSFRIIRLLLKLLNSAIQQTDKIEMNGSDGVPVGGPDLVHEP